MSQFTKLLSWPVDKTISLFSLNSIHPSMFLYLSNSGGWNPWQLPQCERRVHPGKVWNLLRGFISLVNEKCFQPREHSSAYSLLSQTAQASKQNMIIAHHSLLMWRPDKQRSDEGSADTLSWSLQLDDGGVSIFILSVCKCFLLCWWIHKWCEAAWQRFSSMEWDRCQLVLLLWVLTVFWLYCKSMSFSSCIMFPSILYVWVFFNLHLSGLLWKISFNFLSSFPPTYCVHVCPEVQQPQSEGRLSINQTD